MEDRAFFSESLGSSALLILPGHCGLSVLLIWVPRLRTHQIFTCFGAHFVLSMTISDQTSFITYESPIDELDYESV